MATLVKHLLADGREDNVERAAFDPTFRDVLLKEHDLAKESAKELALGGLPLKWRTAI